MRRDYEKGKRKDILSDVLKEKFVLSKGQEIFYTILTYCKTSVILQIEQKDKGRGCGSLRPHLLFYMNITGGGSYG